MADPTPGVGGPPHRGTYPPTPPIAAPNPRSAHPSDADARDTRWPARAAALLVTAAVVALALRQLRGWDGTVNADGVSYLDLARLYAGGHLGAIANGYWSPLYPMLLGAARVMAAPFGVPEMDAAFALNVAIFVGATLALASLARTLDARRDPRASGAVRGARALVAGALAVWCLLRMITATAITPDALLAAWTFLATAHLARAEPSDRRTATFGAVLGLGYWTKAVFFPVALVALAALALVSLGALALVSRAGTRGRAMRRALVPFAAIVLPLVAIQSWTQGRPSFGETGRLNYRWYVAGAPHAPAVDEAEDATRTRALRGDASVVALHAAPDAVLFTGATTGSFPYWLDASRYEPRGGAPLSLAAQWAVLRFNAHWFRATAGAFALFVALALAAALARARAEPGRLLAALPAAAMLALYALTHPEGRMGAGALVCVLLVAVHVVPPGPRRYRGAVLFIECVALAIVATLALGRTAKRIPAGPARVAPVPSAATLRAAGVAPGAAIALVGSPYGQLWAHEGDVRIAAVIPDGAAPRDDALHAVAAECARRGVPLAGIVWQGDASPSRDARAIAPGWWVLRTP